MPRSPLTGKTRRTSSGTRASARTPSTKASPRKSPTRAPKGRYSEERQQAVLICGTDQLAVHLNSPEPVLGLKAAGLEFLAGPWSGALTGPDGRQFTLSGEWQHACWHSDSDGDYLELQLLTDLGVRIDRMLFVERRAKFALLADAVVQDEPHPSPFDSYSAAIPLGPQVTAQPGTSPLELTLALRNSKVRCFPLGLQPDPTRQPGGSLQASAGSLMWTRTYTGGSTWAPLLLDWNPARARKPVIWKSLTVSEGRQIIPPHRAAAARWQCGSEHLLCFRSLQTPESARAVLGFHTWFETIVTRLVAPGKFHTMVQIDPDLNSPPPA